MLKFVFFVPESPCNTDKTSYGVLSPLLNSKPPLLRFGP